MPGIPATDGEINTSAVTYDKLFFMGLVNGKR